MFPKISIDLVSAFFYSHRIFLDKQVALHSHGFSYAVYYVRNERVAQLSMIRNVNQKLNNDKRKDFDQK